MGKKVKNFRRFVILTLVLLFCLGLALPGIASESLVTKKLSDIDNHWAKDQIDKWVDQGFIKGYDDGTFRPNKSITRAEFATLANKAFGFSEKALVNFSDVSVKDWFYDEIAKAVAAGYLSGYQDGTVKPNKEISREEAAVIIARALNISSKDLSNVDNFSDSNRIASWSKSSVSAVVANGFMGGYPDGSFKGANSITRAESVVVLERALAASALSYNKPGIYGPETGIETISKDVAINVAGVTLRNMIIEGNLYLNEGIGEGDAYLNNVTVKGKTTVRGGGKDSIHLTNFTGEELIVIKIGGEVRIVASGSTQIEEMLLQSGARVQGNGIEIIRVLKPGENVILDGNFEKVIVEADAKVEILGDTVIGSLQVNSNSSIELARGATVTDLTLDASATVSGKGTIENANINVSGASLEIEPKNVELAKGVTAEIAGKEVKAETSTPPATGGGGGGDYTPPTPTKYNLTVKANPADGGTVTGTGSYAEGAKVNVTATAKEGYKFANWTVDGKEVSKEASFEYTMPAKANNLVANFEEITIAVSAISVEPTTMTLTVGATGQITATVKPENATNKKVTWSSNDESVATVDAGKVTAVSEGKAVITAKTEDGGFTATCEVTVIPPITLEVAATNFNTEKNKGYEGIDVGFTINGSTTADLTKVESMVVELYSGDTLLARNTAKMDAWKDNNPGTSTPFVVLQGTFDPAEDEYWTYEWMEGYPDAGTKPTKAVITVTDVFGDDYEAVNETLAEPNDWTWESIFETVEVAILSSTRSNKVDLDNETINNFGWFALN